MVPLNLVLMKRMSVYQRQMMTNKDRRLKMMSEILNGMRIIKVEKKKKVLLIFDCFFFLYSP